MVSDQDIQEETIKSISEAVGLINLFDIPKASWVWWQTHWQFTRKPIGVVTRQTFLYSHLNFVKKLANEDGVQSRLGRLLLVLLLEKGPMGPSTSSRSRLLQGQAHGPSSSRSFLDWLWVLALV